MKGQAQSSADTQENQVVKTKEAGAGPPDDGRGSAHAVLIGVHLQWRVHPAGISGGPHTTHTTAHSFLWVSKCKEKRVCAKNEK